MVNVDSVTASGDIDSSMLHRIIRLLSTVKGTVPFDRGFGIDLSSIDNVQDAVGGQLMVEYCRAMLQYFPEYTISSISFTVSGEKINPKVVIGYA